MRLTGRMLRSDDSDPLVQGDLIGLQSRSSGRGRGRRALRIDSQARRSASSPAAPSAATSRSARPQLSRQQRQRRTTSPSGTSLEAASWAKTRELLPCGRGHVDRFPSHPIRHGHRRQLPQPHEVLLDSSLQLGHAFAFHLAMGVGRSRLDHLPGALRQGGAQAPKLPLGPRQEPALVFDGP